MRYPEVLCRCGLLLTAWVCLAAPAAAQVDPSPGRVVEAVNEYRRAHEGQIVRDFVDLLSMPNVAIDLDDMRVNAEHITGMLQSRGFRTQTLQAGGAPYVYAELSNPRATETVLIYAHFDGQPVQEENWAYPPFQPTLLDAPLTAGGQPIEIDKVQGEFDPEWRIYARSAGDDKMPVVAIVHTLDALRDAGIELSVNLKLLFDGEEERGSPTAARVLRESRHLFDADLLLFYDDPGDDVLRAHPKVIKLGWRGSDVSPGLRTPLDAPMSERLIRLMRTITPDLIVTPTMGGTLPLGAFDTELDAPIVILPLANHDNNQHAENENLRLQNLWDAMAVYGAVLATFGYM